MAIVFSQACQFPQDLDAAAAALDQELGDRLIANNELLAAVEAAVPELNSQLDAGSDILNRILATGDGSSTLKSVNDVSDQFGLQKDGQSQEADERFLNNFGVLLYNGVLYVPGTSNRDVDNIQILRELFVASGRNLARTESFLQKSKTLFVYNKLSVQHVPPKKPGAQAFTLAEVRTALSMPHLTADDVIVAEDYTTLVLVRTYLDFDISIPEVKHRYNLSDAEIVLSVFHFDKVDNTTSAIARYQGYGLSTDQLAAVLAGTESIAPIQASITSAKQTAVSVIDKINFVLQRLNTLDLSSKNDFRNKLRVDIGLLTTTHLNIINQNLFNVAVVKTRDTLTKLRARHNDAEIQSLLNNRTDINGIFFDPTDDQLTRVLTNGMTAAPGSTVGSNRFLNLTGLPPVDQSILMFMYADLYDADRVLNGPLVQSSFVDSRRNLTEYIARNPIRSLTNATITQSNSSSTILQGQPSTGTPSSILSELLDTNKTLGMDQRMADVNDAFKGLFDLYPDSIAQPLSRIINIIAKLFEKAMKGLQLLINKAKRFIFMLKKRLDAFSGQFLSLTGSGNFNSSLLKCAVNFDVSLSLPSGGLLDELLKFLNNIGVLVAEFLTKLAKWIADLFEKLLCLPISLINAFLGQVSAALPSACQIPRVKLNDSLIKALTRLRAIGDFNTLVFQKMGGDLLRYRLVINAAPDKLKQFKSSALCNSKQVSTFYNTSILNIGGAIPG